VVISPNTIIDAIECPKEGLVFVQRLGEGDNPRNIGLYAFLNMLKIISKERSRRRSHDLWQSK